MKKLTMILLVACVLLVSCEMIPEITTIAIESDGTFDFVLYRSDGARMDSGYRLKAYYNVVYYDFYFRITPIDDSICVLYVNGVETPHPW